MHIKGITIMIRSNFSMILRSNLTRHTTESDIDYFMEIYNKLLVLMDRKTIKKYINRIMNCRYHIDFEGNESKNFIDAFYKLVKRKHDEEYFKENPHLL